MTTTLLKPAQGAPSEFALAQLADQRRPQRWVKIATNLAHRPGGTLPQAFPVWSELKAADRFFNQPKTPFEEIQRPHWQRTRAACQQPGEYWLIEDTSELDYTDPPATEDLGSIGDGRGGGLRRHTPLAVRIEGWDRDERPQGIVLGLLAQPCWRRWGRPIRGQETWQQRMSRSRESQRWAAALEEGGPPAGSTWIQILDRAGDFYEPIQRCQRPRADFIIRAFHDRVLCGGQGHLKAAVAKAPRFGQLTVALRARAGRAARMAKVEVRATTLSLNGPRRLSGKPPDFQVNVVEVREVAALEGAQPLHCRTWDPGASSREALRPALDGGGVSQGAQERGGGGGQPEGTSLSHRIAGGRAGGVAVRLLNTKWLARTRPDEPVDPKIFGPERLVILAAMFGQPKGGWTHRTVLVAVARGGGFLARRSDGMPGWQTSWRGWQRLMWMCHGVETLKHEQKRYG